MVAGAGRIWTGRDGAGREVLAGVAAAGGEALPAVEERFTRIGTAVASGAGAGVGAGRSTGSRPGIAVSTAGIAESGSKAMATSAASANAEVSACFNSLASELSRASTSPGDCSLVPSPQPAMLRAASASVVNKQRVVIGGPIQ